MEILIVDDEIRQVKPKKHNKQLKLYWRLYNERNNI